MLGSPGSARIISAVAQVTSHWIDIGAGVDAAVAALRVHALPGDRAYVEGAELSPQLLAGMADRGLTLQRPAYGVSDSHLDPYFGGVHALALENASWTGAADPRRDGLVAVAGEIARGRSQFVFDGWSGPPLDVRLFVPHGSGPETPIVIVMHGWSREAQRYFDDWSRLGNKHEFIVVVPQFSASVFPGANDYNSGHVFDADTGEMRPAGEWTFAAIEPLFDDVVARTGSARNSYTLFGHSAGSQFVHRFLFYVPGARVARYIPANAGWYTLPDFSVPYPYGLKDARVTEEQLAAALGKDVVLMLGREDVDRDDPDLRKTPEADAQGRNRFARGQAMFESARKAAEALGAEFNWRIKIIDDAGHVNADMAIAAAELVE